MYYPPSQIQTNLYTSGNEYTLDGNDYQGYYWKTSGGELWTGKSPQDPPNNRLQPAKVTVSNSSNTKDVLTEQPLVVRSYYNINPNYYSARGIDYNPAKLDAKAPQPPLPQLIFPNEQDYEFGEFQRYFCKKNNELKFIEVSEKTYNGFKTKNPTLQWQLYTPIQINWIIAGEMKDVYIVNKRIVEQAALNYNWLGFSTYFKGEYLQYFKFETNEGLFTDGSEFKNRRTGERYRGFYHIHPNKGPMVGKQHQQQPHDFLDFIEDDVETGTSRRKNIVREFINRGGSGGSGGSGGGY